MALFTMNWCNPTNSSKPVEYKPATKTPRPFNWVDYTIMAAGVLTIVAGIVAGVLGY